MAGGAGGSAHGVEVPFDGASGPPLVGASAGPSVAPMAIDLHLDMLGTEDLSSAIEPTVQAVEIKRALAKPTDTLSAYDSYLRALPYYYSQTRGGLGQAEALSAGQLRSTPTMPRRSAPSPTS
jgi:hypothetical protein